MRATRRSLFRCNPFWSDPSWHDLAALLPMVARRPRGFALALLAGAVAQLAAVATPAAGAWLAGRALGGAVPEMLTPGIVLLGLLVPATALGRWWQGHASHDLAFSLIETLQLDLYDGLERSAPDGRRGGDVAATATADAELMEWAFAHLLGDSVGALLVPLAALAALAWISPAVALTVAPVLPVLLLLPVWLARRGGGAGLALRDRVGLLNAVTVEGVRGLADLVGLGAGERWRRRVARLTAAVAAARRRQGRWSGLEAAATEALPALAGLLAVASGAALVAAGRLEATSLPLLLVLAAALPAPLAEIAQATRRLGELGPAATRILAILRLPPAIPDAGGAKPPERHDIRFDAVTFAHPGRPPCLLDVSFTVGQGGFVALSGPSGGGKSSCLDLLLRLREAQGGRILIGGRDIRLLRNADLRRLIAPVLQDIHLFDASVADNIALGRPDAGRDMIERAARLAGIHDAIAALPGGYDARCGKQGTRLSGGQRQRLALARALLMEAPILLLDEATANLDAIGEMALRDAIARIRAERGTTVLMVAHRPATLRMADRVLLLDEGRVK